MGSVMGFLTTGNVTPPPIADDAGWIDVYLHLPELVARDWRRRIGAARASETGVADLHGSRPQVCEKFEQLAAALEKVALFAASQHRGEAAALNTAAVRLRQFVNGLFENWQTQEDLGYLLRIAVLDVTKADTEALVRQHGPPQRWYDEDTSSLDPVTGVGP